MDTCFELMVLNDKPIRNLDVSQEKITWQGVEYPQEPKKYLWGKFIFLTESPIPRHIVNYLPSNFIEQKWICFSIKGKILDLLELEANGLLIDWDNKSLDSLFDLVLSSQSMWVVVFEWHCDTIDNVYKLSIDCCLSQLKSNLKHTDIREGFIVLSSD